MTRRPVSAPGKAFLIGEYAVLEGAPALVTAVDVRAVAHDCDLPDRPAPSDLSLAAHASVRDHLSSGTATEFTLGELPSVDSGPFSRGERKLGFGSSAAVAAAVVGFHLQEAGHDLTRADTRALALQLARAAHHQAQGGGSGGDVAAAVLGGSLRFTRDADPVVLAHPGWLHVGFVDVGQSYESTMPKLSDLRYGVGIGGRYYTNFGPLRLDVATPLGRRKGEGRINIYVSIGQAF